MVNYTVPGMKAERIATLGGSPAGTPGALVAQRSWDDYSIGRADTLEQRSAAKRASKR